MDSRKLPFQSRPSYSVATWHLQENESRGRTENRPYLLYGEAIEPEKIIHTNQPFMKVVQEGKWQFGWSPKFIPSPFCMGEIIRDPVTSPLWPCQTWL